MKLTIFELLKNQLSSIASVDDFRTDLAGKTVIITGGNAGLGFECARHIASMMLGAGSDVDVGRLIIACRSLSKGEEALRQIRESTGYTGGEAWEVDFTKFSTVSAFADKFEREGPGHLDLLILNSGIVRPKYTKTQDGWESAVQTNHLGQALLAFLMFPYLCKAKGSPPTPRLTIVASDRHYGADVTDELKNAPKFFEKLNDEAYCTDSVMLDRYNITKLMNILFARAVAAKIPGVSPIVVNTINPGFCKSSITQELQEQYWYIRLTLKLMLVTVAKTTEEGGRSIAHAALVVDPRKAMSKRDAKRLSEKDALDPKALNGKFISWTRVAEESDFVLSEDGKRLQDRLWNETVEILSAVDGRVDSIIKEYLS